MKNELTPEKEEVLQNRIETKSVSRRKFFGNLGKAAVTVAAVGALPAFDSKSGILAQSDGERLPGLARATQCYNFRKNAAEYNFTNTPIRTLRRGNGDETTYPNKIGNFSKGLPHQSNGEVVLTGYNQLISAIKTQNSTDFEQIPLGGNRKFVNPQSGLAMDIEGRDGFSLIMPPAPKFDSREIAAEISENYWMALLRDVPFEDYPNNTIARAAAADLTLYGNDFKGAKNSIGQITPELLFRGLTSGDKAGPYLSQFFYHSCNFGANAVSQKITTARTIADGGQDYMTNFDSWLAIQNGVAPQNGDILDPTFRYMRNGRDIGQYVHVDVLFQAYFQAFLVVAGLGAPLDSGNPYNNSVNQDGFGTFGGPHIAALLCEVSTRALKAVWNQKWFIHRRLRPEAFAERVDRTAFYGANYPVDSEILNSVNSSSRLGGFLPSGNAFLPQAFPEGSPMHPSYGAGHATVAGACVTILKAFFDESFVIQNPVMPDSTGQVLVPYSGNETLTVGGELNKIASNISLGRNIAGVHWRSDGTESMKLGEELAISIMRDQKACFNEQFNGFSLTKFDGTTITV
jgi:hypothetical protein